MTIVLNQEDMWSIINFEKSSSEIKELTFFFGQESESKLKDKDQSRKNELINLLSIVLGTKFIPEGDGLVGKCVNVSNFAFKDNVAYVNLKKEFSVNELFQKKNQSDSEGIQNVNSKPENFKVNLEGVSAVKIEWK